MSKVTDFINIKTDKVKNNLDLFFHDPEVNKRLQSLNIYPIFSKFLGEGNDYENMREREFNDPSEVMYCFNAYQDIMAEINMKVVFVPSIENFCMFMGWTASVYKQMLTETTEDVRSVMKMIDDYIIESQLSAGQRGITASALTKFRAQIAGDHGNNLVTQKEQNEDDRKQGKLKSKAELQLELQKMGFKTNEMSLIKDEN